MSLFKDIEDRIIRLRNGGSRFSVERMENFARLLKNPQSAFKSVHVAGTNGKGSTCAMLDSIFRRANLSSGLFTSPHLLKINERIQVNRKEISDEDFVRIFLRIEETAREIAQGDEHLAPTFFEYIAALAFAYFKEKSVEWAVVETGMGGRLDATNIISPAICVITSIGFDHTQFLGNTIAEIAAEKAGIIKEGVPVVCGILEKEAMDIIEDHARRKNAPLYKVEDLIGDISAIQTSLDGEYQKKNAAAAILTARVLRDMDLLEISEADIADALLDVRWDARWQTLRLKNGQMILDCSHNSQGAEELEKNLKTLTRTSGDKPVVAVGILGRERAVPLLKSISKYAKKILFLEPSEERALNFDELAECLPENHPEYENTTLEKLFPKKGTCALTDNGTSLVCTGSCYLAGEILARVGGYEKDALSDKL